MSNQPLSPYDIDSEPVRVLGHALTPPSPPSRPIPRGVLNGIATVPSGSNGDGKALIGALAFMEGAATGTMGVPQLLSWLDEFLVRPGYMLARPSRAYEPTAGSVYLGPADANTSTEVRNRRLNKVVQAASKRVFDTLRGLIVQPEDERFLFTFAATGRIWPNRTTIERTWCIGPHPDDAIGDIVLALFAADILSNRQTYRENLCLCSVCGRISFRTNVSRRDRCRTHESTSPLGSILRMFS